MTHEAEKDRERLRHGLPRMLAEDPDKLNDLLGLNRRNRLKLASLVPSEVRARIKARLKDRPEPEKPGEEERILVQWHYSHPVWRLSAWQDALVKRPGPPSLLAIVLGNFIEQESEVGGDDSAESAAGRSESERIADRAWTDTRESLCRWNELEEREREQCVLRTFAVATLRDDPAILTEGIELAPGLHDQFKNLLPREEAEEEADSAPGPPGDATDKWTVLTGSLKDLASRAEGPPPNPNLLDEITTAVEDLRELEPSVRAELSSAAFEEFLAEVREKLAEIKSDSTFRLDDERRASLEDAWDQCRGSLTGDALEEERRQFETAVNEAAEHVRMAARDLSGAKKQIAAHRAEEPEDPFAPDAWDEALEGLQRAERECRKRLKEAQTSLLNALSPRGEALNVSKVGTKSRKSSEPSKPGPPDSEGPSNPPESTPSGPGTPSASPTPPPASAAQPPPPRSRPEPASKAEPVATKSQPSKTLAPATSPKPRPAASPATPKQKPAESPKRKSAAPQTPPSPKPAPRDPLAMQAEEAITTALVEVPPRLAYAFQAARLVERAFPGDSPSRSRLLQVAALADRLRDPEGGIAMRLRKRFAELPAPDSGGNEDVLAFHAMAGLAACLRPALFAPNTGALGVLTSLPRVGAFPALHDLGQRVAAHAAKVQHAGVDLALLQAMRSGVALEAARERCLEEIREWCRDAPRRKILYAPATAVWKRWTHETGEIGKVMARLAAGATPTQPFREAIASWCDRASLRSLATATDRDLRGPVRARTGIQYGALDKLVEEAGKAAALANRYMDLVAAPSRASDYRVQILSELRRELDRCAPAALEEVGSLHGNAPGWVTAGARLAAQAVERLQAALDPQVNSDERETEPDAGDLLASGFFTTRVALDRDDQPIDEPARVLSSLIEQAPRPLEEVVSAHLESGDLFAAQRILAWMESEGSEGPGELRTALGAARDRHGSELATELTLLQDKVETGLMLGSVSADERERHEPLLVEIERQLSDSDFLRFGEMRERLRGIRSELEASERQHLQKVRSELAGLALPAQGPQVHAIEGAIEQGDIVRANEWIQRVREDPNFVVAEEENRSRLDAFFPDAAKAISAALENAGSPREVVERIRAGKLFGGLPPNLPGARRDSAARMLAAWFALKHHGEIGPDGVRQTSNLFSEIGFRVLDVEPRGPSANEILLRTVPLDRRDQCPVPAYGSAARGRYRVICVWKRPTVNDLLRYGDQPGGGAPSIILYFGRLSETQRKELALATRERAQTILVLDEVAMVFLCGERDSRLPVFFNCTLPFSYVQPYSTVGGVAPPEMFYGRDAEVARVTSRNGPCFVYGGRQIGKTAILRVVRDRDHRPSDGHHVFFVDLKAREIGVEGAIADIWPLLWRTLNDGGAIPKDVREPLTKGSVRIEEFLDALIRHFAPGSGRTLLLLLDEADHFLEMDAREQQKGVAATGYRESIRLKRLMDETERSIKVVFAGLHNVLRTVEQANHPLGQFGRPVQVEPLLRNGGMRAAHDLVTRPLRTAGYRLVPDDLVTRILGQTNYYPGLIQAYCAELIGAMLSRCAGKPPFKVTSEVIEAAYRAGGLREFIRGRFHLTLNLDKRYEVIAYSIASLCLSEESALVRGLPRRRIYEEAATWWPAGFADLSGEEFASLLDETVGLGVLRTTGTEEQQTYTLRNPNVLLLMGTKDEIEEKLLEEREPPHELEPRILRARRKPDDPDDPSRSPLTFQQQGRLFAEENGVVLISGVAAAGLKDLLDAFDSQPDRPLVPLEGVPDRESFRTALRGSVKRQEYGLRVHAVSPEAPWTADWIQDAQSYLNSLRKSKRHVRVLFLASGDRLPELMRDPVVLKAPRLKRIFLEPWRDMFVRQWMQDVAIGDSAELRGRILEITGGWAAVLMRLPELIELHGGAEEALEELGTELSDSDQQQEWRRQLSLEDPVTRIVLRPLATYGELSRTELVDEAIGSGVNREEADLRLRAAGHLGLARHRLRWSLNPLVARLIREDE